MKSMSASSASFASLRQSGQLADQRSGTLVAERPDEQLAPNKPILNAWALYIAERCCNDAVSSSTGVSSVGSKGKRKPGLWSRADFSTPWREWEPATCRHAEMRAVGFGVGLSSGLSTAWGPLGHV